MISKSALSNEHQPNSFSQYALCFFGGLLGILLGFGGIEIFIRSFEFALISVGFVTQSEAKTIFSGLQIQAPLVYLSSLIVPPTMVFVLWYDSKRNLPWPKG